MTILHIQRSIYHTSLRKGVLIHGGFTGGFKYFVNQILIL